MRQLGQNASARMTWSHGRHLSSLVHLIPACPSLPGRSHPPTLPATGEAERGAALQVAEARCAAVAGLLDEVQELQGQAEEVRGRGNGTAATMLYCWGASCTRAAKLTARGPQTSQQAVE